jgi:hypothetical protein
MAFASSAIVEQIQSLALGSFAPLTRCNGFGFS